MHNGNTIGRSFDFLLHLIQKEQASSKTTYKEICAELEICEETAHRYMLIAEKREYVTRETSRIRQGSGFINSPHKFTCHVLD